MRHRRRNLRERYIDEDYRPRRRILREYRPDYYNMEPTQENIYNFCVDAISPNTSLIDFKDASGRLMQQVSLEELTQTVIGIFGRKAVKEHKNLIKLVWNEYY